MPALKTPYARRFAADDWGLSRQINEAILALASANMLHSVSILSNGPHLVHRLEELLKAQRRIGFTLALHLNLTEGAPAANPAQIPSLVEASGKFVGQKKLWWRIFCGAIKSSEVACEARAQLEQLLRIGCDVKEINGHHHIHQFYSVFAPVFAATQDLDIKYRIMKDPRHKASYLNAQLLLRKLEPNFPESKLQPTMYLWGTGNRENLRRLQKYASLPFLIHPAIGATEPDIRQRRAFSEQRNYDYEFVKSLSS